MASDAGHIKYTVEVDSKDAEKNLKETGKQADGLAESLERADKQTDFSQLKKAVKSVASVVAKFALDSIKGFSDMQSEIAKATGATGDDLKSMTTSANKALAYLTQSQEEVGRAVGELNTRLNLQGDALEEATLRIGDFARITKQDMQSAVAGTSKLLAAWGLSADKMPKILDKLTVAGQKSGKSVAQLTSELQQNASIFKQFGLSMDEATSMLMTLELQGVESQSALMGMQFVMRKAAAEGRNARVVWDEITQSIRNATTQTEANAIATQYFGRAAGKVVEAVREGKFSFDEFTGSLEKSEGAAKDAAEASLTLSDVIAKLKNMANSIIGELAPAIQKIGPLLDKLMPLVRGVGTALSLAADGAGALVDGVGNVVKSFKEMNKAGKEALMAEAKLADEADKSANAALRTHPAYKQWAADLLALTNKENETREAEAKFLEKHRDMSWSNGKFIDQDVQAQWEDLQVSTDKAAKAVERYTEKIEEATDRNLRQSGGLKQLIEDGRKYRDEMQAGIEAEDKAKRETNELAGAMNGLADAVENAGDSFKEAMNEALAAAQPYFNQVLSLAGQAGSVLSQLWSNQTAEVEKEQSEQLDALTERFAAEEEMAQQQYDSELLRIDALRARRELSDEEYASKKAQLESDLASRLDGITRARASAEEQVNQSAAAKKNEIAKKEFDTNKALNIVQTTINGATAVMKALADLGPIAGGIAAGLITAMTAAQIGLIASQQFTPSYDTGSGVLGSDRMAQLHRGERVLNRADTERLESMGGLSALSPSATLADRSIIIDNNLNATIEADGLQLALAVMRHWEEAKLYVG